VCNLVESCRDPRWAACVFAYDAAPILDGMAASLPSLGAGAPAVRRWAYRLGAGAAAAAAGVAGFVFLFARGGGGRDVG
jgi:hypothetical protein